MDTLEDHLRRVSRNFTARIPEEQVLALGRDLARELARAHAESPPRHPDLDPARIPMAEGRPRLTGGAAGDTGEDLFQLGALLASLLAGSPPDVSWRLDGPPAAELSTILRRHALAALATPRRDLRLPTAAAAAEALEAALAPPDEAPAAWPAFRGDAARSGWRPAAGSASGFELLWEAVVGACVASPVPTARMVLAATADGRLLFLDRASGQPLHELRLGGGIESSPALAGRLLYVGTDDGQLVAVDVVAGREAFRTALGSMVRSSPVLAGERVLVGVVEAKGQGGLACLDAAKGKLLWQYRAGAVFSSPALAGERVLIGCDDGALHAVNLADGKLAWSHPLGAKVRATPAIAGDLAVVGDFGGRLVAVRVADGTRAWTLETGHAIYSSACLGDGRAVVGCNDGHVHGVDLAGGAARFEQPLRGPVTASPLGLGDRCVVGSTAGELCLLGAGGEFLAQLVVSRAGIQSSAAVDGADVFVGSGTGVHAVRLEP
jgi:outer membrane protein assembly factor BamB